MNDFAAIFNNPDCQNDSVMTEVSIQSPTAIIMRFLLWIGIRILKSAWVVVYCSVSHSIGIVAVIAHYFGYVAYKIWKAWIHG